VIVSNPEKDDPREDNHCGINALKLAADGRAAAINLAHGVRAEIP
jgi:hypothetical protein